jgi:hypothetical protein
MEIGEFIWELVFLRNGMICATGTGQATEGNGVKAAVTLVGTSLMCCKNLSNSWFLLFCEKRNLRQKSPHSH